MGVERNRAGPPRRGVWLAVAASGLFAAGALAVGAPAARAQEGDGFAAPQAAAPDDALGRLFARARDGAADPHLPFILSRLKRALADQDLLGVLSLLEPAYFEEQYLERIGAGGRSPGESLGQFACELFSICDISKTYSFNDIVSAEIVSVSPEGGLTGGVVSVTLELRMWDGLSLLSVISYNPATAKLAGPVG